MKHLKTYESKGFEKQKNGHFYTCIHKTNLKSKLFTIGKKYEEYIKNYRGFSNKILNDTGKFSLIDNFTINKVLDFPIIGVNYIILRKLGIEIYKYQNQTFFVKDIEFDDLIIKINAYKYNL